MAKKQLDLPLSGRKNIITWMEKFRNNGLKQSTMDFFNSGNNYTTNAKIENFNKKVAIFKRAFKAIGVDLKPTPRGRVSITASKLKKLTPTNMTDELKEFIFDEDLAAIKFDDSDIIDTLTKLRKKNKHKELKSLVYFELFAKEGNIPALEWLINEFGVDNYNLKNYPIRESIAELSNIIIEDKLLDFLFRTNLVSSETQFLYGNVIIDLVDIFSEKNAKKIISLINIQTHDDVYNFIIKFKVIITRNSNLLDELNFGDQVWKNIAYMIMDRITKPDGEYWDLIGKFMEISPTFQETMINTTDWKYYDKVLENIPDVKDIFMF